ncbi:MAG: hypothetical protein IKS39_02670 [Clostridia bacterium]|nr:hypothetical protein [Clostridia bacterium]
MIILLTKILIKNKVKVPVSQCLMSIKVFPMNMLAVAKENACAADIKKFVS